MVVVVGGGCVCVCVCVCVLFICFVLFLKIFFIVAAVFNEKNRLLVVFLLLKIPYS